MLEKQSYSATSIYYPEKVVRERICQDFYRTKGKGVLFVIDSFDQVNEQQMSGTVFQQLVDEKFLEYANLMVLSRPVKPELWRHDKLMSLASKLGTNQQIEMSGFNVDHYFKSACSDELLAALKPLYLSNSHTLIYSQMSIPVHSAMVAGLFHLHWNNGDRNFFPIL